MGKEMEFTAVYQKRDRWYVAWVEELPGVNTEGKTLREPRASLKEALRLVIETNRELSSKDQVDSIIREPLFLEI